MTTYYTKSHEWIRVDGEQATVGITTHASEELGELVFVEAKDEGTEVAAGDAAAVVESVKAASDIYAPVAGTLAGFNEALSDDPTLVGRDAEGEGWIFRMTVSNPDDLKGLLTAEQYKSL
ncbi:MULTISPECIES: glycine cleavage system protein GcvH [Gluconobacter]|uniref:Glycine cleavage system H protein n=1 Tax=Gluconobacter albidus TaxID=318683 RepID=A0A149TKU6_9PROT|nr:MULTISPECIES: glycine cleavage system protein GcvH [Gluconobacter]AQS91760.1 glycine cleavage system protein H [Gluconobacter albidus]KXV49128.1 glycine cleavage system protein H [Gluconobacter albidus]MBS1029355.1 glycine cleavage system protein GcvH [Gluconobacter albidus]OUI84671.1 glycine cleavage system protein H [Gluconobacter sp. DsW_056]